MKEKNKEPLFHIVKRDALPWYKSLGIRFLAILLALILCGIITTITTGINPLQVYQSIVLGAFGSVRKTWVTFQNIAILLLIALALTPAFKMKFWNIGGEGQGHPPGRAHPRPRRGPAGGRACRQPHHLGECAGAHHLPHPRRAGGADLPQQKRDRRAGAHRDHPGRGRLRLLRHPHRRHRTGGTDQDPHL